MPRFVTVRYVWQILGRRGTFCPPPPLHPIREQQRKKPIKKTINDWLKRKILYNTYKTPETIYIKRVFTWDFISGEMKYFQFSVWSILFITVYVKYPEMKLIAGVISLGHFDRNEISFRIINVMEAVPRNGIILKETSALANIS